MNVVERLERNKRLQRFVLTHTGKQPGKTPHTASTTCMHKSHRWKVGGLFSSMQFMRLNKTRERSSRPSETCNAEEPEGPEERRCCGEGQTAPLVACVLPDNSGGVHCAVPLAGLLLGLHISLRLCFLVGCEWAAVHDRLDTHRDDRARPRARCDVCTSLFSRRRWQDARHRVVRV